MENPQPRFWPLLAKTAVCHTLTYFVMGLLAAYFLNYAAVLSAPNSGMRPMTDPWVMAGPLLQPLRGILYALVFYPLRSFFLHYDSQCNGEPYCRRGLSVVVEQRGGQCPRIKPFRWGKIFAK